MEYSAKIAYFLGTFREYSPWASIGTSGVNSDKAKNMDLWNNYVNREYGKKSKTRKELFWHLLKALKNGELITDLNDSRKYSASMDSAIEKINGQVIVLEESKTGENLLFLDTQTLLVLSKERFVAKIKNGEYGKAYEVRFINGKEVPASKKDRHSNLG